MKIIVLGGGIIGVTTAYFLARDGHEVVVIEKNAESGLACSYANGGQLSYSHIEPWSSREALKKIFIGFFKPHSFIAVSDIFNINLAKWFWKFLRNSSKEKTNEIAKNLYSISSYSKEALEEIILEEGKFNFEFKKHGILHFFRNQKTFDAAIKQAENHSNFGCKAQILTKDECIKKEPTLVKLYDDNKLAGGIFYNSDASGNPFLFIKALEKICREKYNVKFEYNTEIRNIFTNHKKITGINTSKGVFAAESYVCCLGAYGNNLLKGIKINTNIYPLKGYSLSIEANHHEFIAPMLSVSDPENKIVYSRLGNIFRVAGSVEACGYKNKMNKKLLNFLYNTIKSTFSDFGNLNSVEEWQGFRPFRPNSIPLICKVEKYGNLFINSGHGSLGWTLSAGSAKILANLVKNKNYREFEFLKEEEKCLNF